MYGVSSAFKTAIKASHTIATKLEVLTGGIVQSTPGLRIIGGSVTVDKTNAVRRQCTITLADATTDPTTGLFTNALIPKSATSLLAPYGTEFKPYRGVTYPDGTVELVPLGVFRISSARVKDAGEQLTVELTGYDRARAVQRARFTDTYAIASGTDLGTAIQALITSRVPNATFNFVATTGVNTTGVTYQAGDDPWKSACDLATANGYELYVDTSGAYALRVELDTTGAAAVWDFTEGSTMTATSLERTMTDEEVYNDVIVTGEGTGVVPPVRGQARDTTATSPTYYLGTFGDVPYFYSSPLMATSAMAGQAATSILNRVIGFTDQIAFDAVPMPALDVSDVVTVTRGALGLSAAPYVVERLKIPLEASGKMTVSTRLRRS